MGKRSLIHDRDSQCAQACDGLLKESGVEPVILPPRRPHLNAHGQRFGRSIKEEALHRMVMLGEPTLSEAISQSLSHDHAERKHQGLDNPRMARAPSLGSRSGQGKRRERLEGY